MEKRLWEIFSDFKELNKVTRLGCKVGYSKKKCRKGRKDFLLNVGCRVGNHLNTRWDKWELKGLKLKDCKMVRMTLNQKF